MRKFMRAVLGVGFGLLMHASQAQAPATALGVPIADAEIERFSITIFPDGRNLPPGQGTVTQGRGLYQGQCAMCHGANGIEGPASRLAGSDGFFSLSDPFRILRILKHPRLIQSVGAQWPYATSIFDYVRRAMPHYAPKSLKDDEVYALTGYILYMNQFIEEDTVIDRASLPKVTMTGLARSVSGWPGETESGGAAARKQGGGATVPSNRQISENRGGN